MDDNSVEAQKVINYLLEQVKQLTLNNAMLMARMDHALEKMQSREELLK